MPKQKAEPLPPRVCRLKAHLGPVILQESAKRKINTADRDTKEQIFAECVKAFENRRDFVSHCTGLEKREKRRICYYQKGLKRSHRLEPWANYKETALNKSCKIMISFGYKIKGSLGADHRVPGRRVLQARTQRVPRPSRCIHARKSTLLAPRPQA